MSSVVLLPPTSDVTRTEADTLSSKWWSVNTKSYQDCRQGIEKQLDFICPLTQIPYFQKFYLDLDSLEISFKKIVSTTHS